MTDEGKSSYLLSSCCPLGKLPDHLLIEIFIRVPISEWGQVSCVKKQWANLFREECLWHAALVRSFPLAGQAKGWPGPIPRGLSKRQNRNGDFAVSFYPILVTVTVGHPIRFPDDDLITASRQQMEVFGYMILEKYQTEMMVKWGKRFQRNMIIRVGIKQQ